MSPGPSPYPRLAVRHFSLNDHDDRQQGHSNERGTCTEGFCMSYHRLSTRSLWIHMVLIYGKVLESNCPVYKNKVLLSHLAKREGVDLHLREEPEGGENVCLAK